MSWPLTFFSRGRRRVLFDLVFRREGNTCTAELPVQNGIGPPTKGYQQTAWRVATRFVSPLLWYSAVFCRFAWRRLFPFRKQAMPFLTVHAIIGNQAFQNGRYHICFSSGLDKVETDYNLLMEFNAHTKCLIVHIHTGLLAVSFYLYVGAALSLIFKKVTFYN